MPAVSDSTNADRRSTGNGRNIAPHFYQRGSKMTILKRKTGNESVDSETYTADGRKGTLRYVAIANKRGVTLNILLGIEYSDDAMTIASYENIPSEIFEDAVKERMFRNMVERSGNKYDWYDDSKWKLALIPADEQSKVMDSATLNRFEVAIIKRCELVNAGNFMRRTIVPESESYKRALNDAQAEVDHYRKILLGLEEESDDASEEEE